MLSYSLRISRAARMNILIVRAFVKMRELVASHNDLAGRVLKLETNQKRHAYVIGVLADEVDKMKKSPEPCKRPIGLKMDR